MDTQAPTSTPQGLTKVKAFVSEIRITFKETGFKGVFRRYGWKMVAAIFFYYLIRDSFLYIFIPWMIAKRFILE